MNCVVISLLKGIEGDIIKLSMFFQLSTSNIIIKKHKVASCYKLKWTPELSREALSLSFGVMGRMAH